MENKLPINIIQLSNIISDVFTHLIDGENKYIVSNGSERFDLEDKITQQLYEMYKNNPKLLSDEP